MRQVLRRPLRQTGGRRVAKVKMMPPPVGGWNDRDSLASMPDTDAVQLDDWFPEQSSVRLRPGYAVHCNTAEGTQNIAALIPHRHAGVDRLIAAINGKIFNVTTSTPSSLATGLTNNDWAHSPLGGLTILCNGADVVKSYNGSVIANPAFTGVTLSLLNHVTTYKSRLYFVEKDTKIMWYGGVGSVAGALTSFNFGNVLGVHGDLKLVGHLSGDGGDGGADDIFVAIFKGGTVAAYTGSDPGSDFSLLGVYQIGEPLSRLGLIQSEDDIYLVTSRGYERLSDTIRFGRATQNRRLLSDKIQKTVARAVTSGDVADTWRMHIYPNGQMLIVTVPGASSARTQHVRNINTGAWCKFTMPALCWAQLGQGCYFGSTDGKVYRFDNASTSDNGTAIRGIAQPAWNFLSYPGYQKEVKLIRPYFLAETHPATAVSTGANFETIGLGSFAAAGAAPASAVWDTAIWDTSVWSVPIGTQSRWFSRPEVGDAIGVKIAVESSNLNVSWNATAIAHVLGGPTV